VQCCTFRLEPALPAVPNNKLTLIYMSSKRKRPTPERFRFPQGSMLRRGTKMWKSDRPWICRPFSCSLSAEV
jgi:hypothetical protein